MTEKLIRDRIPALAAQEGRQLQTRIATGQDIDRLFGYKLIEESAEVIEALALGKQDALIDELADLQTVIDDLAADDFRDFTFGISHVEHLLKSRSSRGKTTVLSTRLGPDDLSTEYPSILHSMRGTFHAVSCAGAERSDEASAQLRKDLGG